jgi:hypothetical protein
MQSEVIRGVPADGAHVHPSRRRLQLRPTGGIEWPTLADLVEVDAPHNLVPDEGGNRRWPSTLRREASWRTQHSIIAHHNRTNPSALNGNHAQSSAIKRTQHSIIEPSRRRRQLQSPPHPLGPHTH